MMHKFIVLLLSGLCLVGCSSRMEMVNQKMDDIRKQPTLPIEPPPVFEPAPTFEYAAHQLRSPFISKSLADELKLMAGKKVYPNLSRPRQALESYALETLMMKGSLKNRSGKILGLIQTPDHEIERIQVGSYMGLNHGRVTTITPLKIDLVEIIPDGRDGYVERPRSLVLMGTAP